ncbi:MAG: efflux RND transporter periplasmic adaptor subunit [Halioglobus sp.]|nr:efflux RND transporter periplasmic adaptor subunit [Halioglobus sp.]
MNSTRMLIAIAIAAVLGGAVGWWLARPADTTGNEAADGGGAREILYWVAPMDPDYRRDEPGKSPMGMDLVPVYANEAGNGGDDQPSLRIDPSVINNIGVKIAKVERGPMVRRIDTVGFITPNEHRVSHVHVRSEGWIEHLAVHTEGARVERGDVLFQFFAPALVSAQEEFVQALATGQHSLIDATRRRLLALGLLPGQIEQLQRAREVHRLIDIKAQQSGYVTALNVRHGMFVKPELMVMSIADLSEIWVEVDIFEGQIDRVAPGQTARVRLPFAPGREWVGEVDYVYPTIRAGSRTGRVRLAFDNPDLALKPNMYADVEIDAAPRRNVLQVPAQAVIRSGAEERVIVALGDGRFRPAEVRTGLESEGRVEILDGLAEGEQIVISSQFLIDSEASLDASLLRLLAPAEHNPAPAGDNREKMDHADGDMATMENGGETR